MASEQANSKIDERISRIPSEQFQILSNIWVHFWQHQEWPDGVLFRKQLGRQVVAQTITGQSPLFVHHIKNLPSEDYYKLTLEGVYAVERWTGPYFRVLLLFLDFVKKKFNQNPRFEAITAREFREGLPMLDDQALRILGELLAIDSPSLFSSSQNLLTPDWELGFLGSKDEVEKLDDARTPQDYLVQKWNAKLERAVGQPVSSQASLIFNTFRSSYEVVGDPIGEGANAIVYKVRDPSGSIFAIKCLKPGKVDTEQRKRFVNESSFCYGNKHENIVQVIDYGLAQIADKQAPFFVMPYYTETLRRLIQKGIPHDQVMDIFSGILNGVEEAHRKGIIHRDLKPENILCDSSTQRFAVGDFGIAHFSEEQIVTTVETKPHDRLANFMYAAPEQRNKQDQVDQRADIYALGLMLNEMFTQQVPFGSAYKKIEDVAPRYSYLDGLVEKMICQSPSERLPSIEIVRQTLTALANHAASLQETARLRSIVVRDAQISDPLVDNPVSVNGIDYKSGHLIITLTQEVNDDWMTAFISFPKDGIAMSATPDRFQIRGNTATVRAVDDEHAQLILNNFKEYLVRTNRRYKELLLEAQEQKRLEEQRKIAQQIEEEQTRQKILKNLRI